MCISGTLVLSYKLQVVMLNDYCKTCRANTHNSNYYPAYNFKKCAKGTFTGSINLVNHFPGFSKTVEGEYNWRYVTSCRKYFANSKNDKHPSYNIQFEALFWAHPRWFFENKRWHMDLFPDLNVVGTDNSSEFAD